MGFRAIRKKKWGRIILGISFLLLACGGVYGYMFYRSLANFMVEMHQPIERINSNRIVEIPITRKVPYSMLILGVDERKNDKGRSDTMLVVAVNPAKKSTKIVSIPRDTRVEMIGRGKMDKMNHAYAFGGIEMALHTVEKFLDIPIDYYVKINMLSFEELINKMGGISVDNRFAFTYDGIHFPKGEVALNGHEALTYARMRKDDPQGDFGRQYRQRLVLESVIHKAASLSSFIHFNPILKTLSSHIKSNLTFPEMVSIHQNYQAATQNIEHVTISGKNAIVDGVYFFQIPDSERLRIHNILQAQLELK